MIKKNIALQGACLLSARVQQQYVRVSTAMPDAVRDINCHVTMIRASCVTAFVNCGTLFIDLGAFSVFLWVSSDELHTTCFLKSNYAQFFVHYRQCNSIFQTFTMFFVGSQQFKCSQWTALQLMHEKSELLLVYC